MAQLRICKVWLKLEKVTVRVPFLPIAPAGVGRLEFGQFAIGVKSADAGQAGIAFQVIPQALGFVVPQYKGVAVGPSAGTQGQNFPIDLATVHGSQIDQWSESYRHVRIAEFFVGYFERTQNIPGGIGAGKAVQGGTQDHKIGDVTREPGSSGDSISGFISGRMAKGPSPYW